MTSEVTPDTDYMRSIYPDDPREFDRWVRTVQAEAWDEAAKSSHLVDTSNLFYISHGKNPYRS
jgi:hypothetical protein